MSRSTVYGLPLVGVRRQPGGEDGDPLIFSTVQGDIAGRYHPVSGGMAVRGVVWLPGTGNGIAGPAHGLYRTLAQECQAQGIESLRIDYRRVNRLEECVRDALVATYWLTRERGIERIALVGHAIGGSAAIIAGVAADEVRMVAALAAPATAAQAVAALGKPLFLGHGADDEVVPATASLRLEQRAPGDVTCRIYPGALHDLDHCRDALSADLIGWLDDHL